MKKLIYLACLLALISCNSKNSEFAKIQVVGSAELEVVPNEIKMVFTIREYMKTPGNKVEIDSVKQQFLALCKQVGIADSTISVIGYSGNERWEYYWRRRNKQNTDFLASVSYQIVLDDLKKADQIVAGLNTNAVDNFYVSGTSHTNLEKLRQDVKKNALQAAKAKADYMAKSLNQSIGKAIFIQEIEDSQQSDRVYQMDGASNMAEEVARPQSAIAEPSFQKVRLRYEVMAQFELK